MKRLDGEEPLHPSLLLLYLCLLLINHHVQILSHLPSMRVDVLLLSVSECEDSQRQLSSHHGSCTMDPDVLATYLTV